MLYGQRSPNLIFLLEITDAVSSRLKRRETFQRVISVQFKSQHLWWYGDTYVHFIYLSAHSMNAERYIKVLEHYMLPTSRCLFQGRPCVFQKDNAKPQIAAITTAWLRSRRVRVLNWPACSADLSPIENIWCIIKQKNMSKMTTNSSAAGNIYQARMGPDSNTKTPETHNLDAQSSSSCFEKKRRYTPW